MTLLSTRSSPSRTRRLGVGSPFAPPVSPTGGEEGLLGSPTIAAMVAGRTRGRATRHRKSANYLLPADHDLEVLDGSSREELDRSYTYVGRVRIAGWVRGEAPS